MSKQDLAMYLVNLHTLLQAQESVGTIDKSNTLLEEYKKNWDLLKQEIKDEARNGNDDRRSEEGRADVSRGESGLRR